jgi:hypothetical protein
LTEKSADESSDRLLKVVQQHWVDLQARVRATGGDVSGVTTQYTVPGTTRRGVLIMIEYPDSVPPHERVNRSDALECRLAAELDLPIRVVDAHQMTQAEKLGAHQCIFQRLT